MYQVIEYFEDLQDNGQPYNVGDVFPKGDKKVTKERLEELATDKNRRKKPLIKAIEKSQKKKKAKPIEE